MLTMNFQVLANSAVFSWPIYYGDFALQCVTNLLESNSWANVAGTVGNQYFQTNGPISGNRFYRLKGN